MEITLREFLAAFQSDPLVRRYLYDTPWTSGCQTPVCPITVEPDKVTVQWNSNRDRFRPFIRRIVEKYPKLFTDGRFRKSDGSCPSTITFYRKKE